MPEWRLSNARHLINDYEQQCGATAGIVNENDDRPENQLENGRFLDVVNLYA